MTETKNVGRLAFRVEGNKWTCYYAMSNTMDGAIWMGSIAMGIVQNDKARKDTFITLMREALADFIEEKIGGHVESWDTKPAPEGERSGSA
jgi:hypothetical protein